MNDTGEQIRCTGGAARETVRRWVETGVMPVAVAVPGRRVCG